MIRLFTPIIIDIEASGFGRGSYPIEVGFITSDQQVACTLVKPEENWSAWNSEAEKVHGIDRSILLEKGKPIIEVALWLNEHLQGKIIYSDAWLNDMCWLGRLFEEAEVTQAFKLESLLSLLTEDEREQWAEMYQLVLSETKLIRHRASTDAKLIQETYIKLKQSAMVKNQNHSS
tara:strand:- start:29282 stop:29806 length:525 start_codon:yes stop_codon:yes gene_type:complete